MAYRQGSPLGLHQLLVIIIFAVQIVSPQLDETNSYTGTPDRWQQVSQTAQTHRRVAPRDRCSESGACYPPTGDLMIGRETKLTATSTCRENQVFCEHDVLNSTRNDNSQTCRHTCSSDKSSSNYFGIENIVNSRSNGMQKRWQSEPGVEEVSIQLNLETEFQFTHLFMTFHTFRPKAMIIEKSVDMGRTFQPIAYFAHDCAEEFPNVMRAPKKKLLDVVCEERYSQLLPKQNGKVLYSNLSPKEEASKKSNFRELDEILKMTNLRLTFKKLHKLGDDVIGDSESLKQKYYYALKSLTVRGTCSCYGHASECIAPGNQPHPAGMIHGQCKCDHFTEGLNCNKCAPLYNDLPWERASKEFPTCKKCECNHHSDECEFDEQLYLKNGKRSGGRCSNCQHHTAGANCELCEDFYYRDPRSQLSEHTVCRPCECNPVGSENGGRCDQYDLGDQRAGRCLCKENVHGAGCSQCKPGFWNMSATNSKGCDACQCELRGIKPGSQGCDERTGKCSCKDNVIGQACDACAPGHYGLEEGPTGCKPCDCDRGGSINPDTCDLRTGECTCKRGVTGRKCDQILDGFFVALPDHLLHEAELATNKRNTRVIMRAPSNVQSNMRDFTGVGFMDIGRGGMIELEFPVIPWTGEYNVYVRSDPRSHDQEIEMTLIRGARLEFDGQCKKSGSAEEPRDLIRLQARTADTAPAMQVCLEKDVKVILRLQSTADGYADNAAQVLIDSVVLVPNYEKLDVYPKDSHIQHVSYCLKTIENYGLHNLYEPCKKVIVPGGLAIWNQAFECNCGSGTTSKVCNKLGGQCPCKQSVVGRTCERCDTTSFGLELHEECRPCDCDTEGSRTQFCDKEGKCSCIDDVYGDKCSDCKPGFWGSPRSCQKCECNGRAELCESKTGICINCRDNTGGVNCEKCVEGYYGDPRRGIPCRPCLCPGNPAFGLNHASSCTLSEQNDMSCICLPGYKGDKCDECANNYFGNPNQPNGTCIPCECNNKINLYDEGNCDPVTGKCLRCLQNTEGDQCDVCKQGHYKNTTVGRDFHCLECSCNPIGSKSDQFCDRETGKCKCHENVIGDECERCADFFYDFQSGKGCKACNCDPHGTVDGSLHCGNDGQCHCRPGRGGKRCNECSNGFYGDPAQGCYRCDCDRYEGAIKQVCDPFTGHCKCKTGMAGPRCDQCARGYKGRAPNCEPCDPCFKDWDEIIKDLDERTRKLTDTARLIKQTGTSGVHKEFAEIERYLTKTKEILANANLPGLDLSQRQNLLDELKHLLEKVENKLKEVETDNSHLVEASLRFTNDVVSLDREIENLKNDIKLLEQNMTELQEGNVQGAYDLIKDNLLQAKQYEAKAHQASETIDNSSNIRSVADRMLNKERGQFTEVHALNERLLGELDREIGSLERTVPEINRFLCASNTSIDGCRDQCGGVGCDHCGDQSSCETAAVRRAKAALDVAVMVDEKVQEKQTKATKMRDDIEAARSAANQAHSKALEVHQAVIEANKLATDSLESLRSLLGQIESLLKKAEGTPADIRRIAQECLDLKVDLTPEQIETLSRQIEATITSLSDIDKILAETEKDKRTTNDLKIKASKVQEEVQKVLGSAQAVQKYLEEAARDQGAARGVIQEVTRALNNAKNEITDLGRDGEEVKAKAQTLLTETQLLKDRLGKVLVNKTEIEVKLDALKADFQDAQREVNDVHGLSETLNANYQKALTEIQAKSVKESSNKGTADNLRQRAQKLYADITGKMSELQHLEDFFVSNERKIKDYNDEIGRLLREMEAHQAEIDRKAVFYQVCLPK